jgi:predicted enzyme related to lactoylglutathione lyase
VSEHPRLHGLSIDVPRADHARAVAFWGAAFGVEPAVSEKYPEFAQLADVTPGCYVLVQATGDSDSGIHLDYATTQRDRDADRLVAAGAEEVSRDYAWAVLRDPADQPFCLCPVEGCG